MALAGLTGSAAAVRRRPVPPPSGKSTTIPLSCNRRTAFPPTPSLRATAMDPQPVATAPTRLRAAPQTTSCPYTRVQDLKGLQGWLRAGAPCPSSGQLARRGSRPSSPIDYSFLAVEVIVGIGVIRLAPKAVPPFVLRKESGAPTDETKCRRADMAAIVTLAAKPPSFELLPTISVHVPRRTSAETRAVRAGSHAISRDLCHEQS